MHSRKFQQIKILVVFCILVITNISFSATSILGGRGLFMVEDARTEGVGVVTLSSFILSHKITGSGYCGDIIAPNVTYAPADFVELFFRTGIAITKGQIFFPDIWNSDITSVSHDKVAGGKISIPYIPVIKFGAKLTYSWPGVDRSNVSVIERLDGFDWVGLATLRFSELAGGLPNIIVNYSQDADTRKYGAGLEISGSGGAIFVEAKSSTLNSGSILSSNVFDNVTITPGVRINLGAYSNISGGVILDVKNNPEIPDYTVIFGLTLGSAFLRPKKPAVGTITGTVTDVQSGAALKATIDFPDQPKIKSVESNQQTGVFKLENIPAGVIVAEVKSDGYQTQTTPMMVETNKINGYDFKLKSSISYGVIAGNVYDDETSKPLEAQITFSDLTLPITHSDSTTGSFRIDNVRTGTITVEAKKDGYFSKSMTITVEEGKVNQVDIRLVPSIYKGSIIGKISDKSNGNPVKGSITFPGTAISPITSDAITGVYFAELPVGVYPLVVTASGYQASTGIIAIEKNKPIQSDFELVKTQIQANVFIGKISDKITGKPLKGTITFPGTMTIPIIADSLTGIFHTELPVGTYPVAISALGYNSTSDFIAIEKDKVTEKKFDLMPLVTKEEVEAGIVIGKITDKVTGNPLTGTIAFPGTTISPVTSDSVTGIFQMTLPIGAYSVLVSAQNYNVAPGIVIVEKEKPNEKNFELVPIPTEIKPVQVVQETTEIKQEIITGIVIGKISNKTTGKPIVGTITFPGTEFAPIISDSMTGIYQKELPVGSYPVTVMATGFMPLTGVITITKDKPAENYFELTPAEFTAILTGQVIDKKTGLGLKAIIAFPETGIMAISTDSITGIYRADIPVGSYLAESKAEGYISQSTLVILEKDKVTEKNFSLVSKGMTITLKGVYFETNKSTLKPESYSILLEASKILTDNPKIKVEIQGYTDNIGPEQYNQTLSEKRAYAVMNYLVQNLGIAPERLSAKGYGEINPIASNNTEEGRALNRRVDFKIVEEK